MSSGRERSASSPTVADVAEAAGVSFATAARALSGPTTAMTSDMRVTRRFSPW